MSKFLTPAQRKRAIRYSNNPENPHKNCCALQVAEKLGAEDATDYLHTIGDLIEAVEAVGWRTQAVKGHPTVGANRGICAKYAAKKGVKFYMVQTPEHVILLNRFGETIVDSAPRKRDRRRVMRMLAIFK